MDSFADERDFNILEDDKYTFFVLRHIISGTCKLLLTDHERLIICFTDHPFPVWIWTPDDASESEMEKAYQIASEHSLLNGEYRFNLKYELAQYFMERAAANLLHLQFLRQILLPLQSHPRGKADADCRPSWAHERNNGDYSPQR